MEDRHPRKSEGLATPGAELFHFGTAKKQRRSQTVDAPDVDLRLDRSPPVYHPEEVLSCEYTVDFRGSEQLDGKKIVAIETSVLWRTEGKGDTDFGVHFFERRDKKNVVRELLSQRHKLSTKLPQTPLSYDGEIVKVRWLVRVRMFLEDGTELTHDEPFRLGEARSFVVPKLGLVSPDG